MNNMGIQPEKEDYEDFLTHLPVDGKCFRYHCT